MSETKRIKIILADDHKLVTEGLMLLLAGDNEIDVVGVASNGKELMTLLNHVPADLVLLDVLMPVMDGCEAAKLIQTQHPETKVLALSMLEKEQHIIRMLEAGAAGYILKDSGKDELRAAIKLVAGGNRFMGAGLFSKLQNRQSVDSILPRKPFENSASLSNREIEVLNLIADGYTNAEIAEKLFVSKRTIEAHRLNIFEKTNAKNTANLIKQSIQQGYISVN